MAQWNKLANLIFHKFIRNLPQVQKHILLLARYWVLWNCNLRHLVTFLRKLKFLTSWSVPQTNRTCQNFLSFSNLFSKKDVLVAFQNFIFRNRNEFFWQTEDNEIDYFISWLKYFLKLFSKKKYPGAGCCRASTVGWLGRQALLHFSATIKRFRPSNTWS